MIKRGLALNIKLLGINLVDSAFKKHFFCVFLSLRFLYQLTNALGANIGEPIAEPFVRICAKLFLTQLASTTRGPI
ncbi:MAG: hypothetical protein CMB45_02890 [Euryarchaeota archaeon]|nr:hypothetical protein [Euryarchaeota archaeon]